MAEENAKVLAELNATKVYEVGKVSVRVSKCAKFECASSYCLGFRTFVGVRFGFE